MSNVGRRQQNFVKKVVDKKALVFPEGYVKRGDRFRHTLDTGSFCDECINFTLETRQVYNLFQEEQILLFWGWRVGAKSFGAKAAQQTDFVCAF